MKTAKRIASLLLVLTLIVGDFPAVQARSGTRELAKWSFDRGLDGWYYGEGWDSAYHGTKPCELTEDNGKMRIDMDWSKDGENGWAQIAICYWYEKGFNMEGANRMVMNVTYEKEKFTDGKITFKIYSNAGVNDGTAIEPGDGKDIGNGLMQVKLKIDFGAMPNVKVQDWNILVIGNNTTYKGSIWMDSLSVQSTDGFDDEAAEDYDPSDIYVDARLVPTDYDSVSFNDSKLLTGMKNGARQSTALNPNVKLADGKADANTRRMYAYLEAMGRSDAVIFGHQSNTWQKVGSAHLSCSDTMDLVGSFSGVIGLDALALTGTEYSVAQYNRQFGKNYEDTITNRVKVYAELSNWNIDNGAIMTLSCHMPNFALADKVSAPDGSPTYAYYDFDDYTCVDLRGDTANKVLPGGEYNEKFNAYLDLIADYLSQVKDTVLFRPFHENTGSWFWWGAAFCDAETYKNLYRYTVEYLRDVKNIHNVLYLYGPGSEAASMEEYGERYPGDAWVDIVGFDMYHSDGYNGDGWMDDFRKELKVVDDFAQAHGKLVAVTETGPARSAASEGDSATALLRTGNQYKGWYQDVNEIVSASNACYFLTWTNFLGGTNGFYTPYVVSVKKNGAIHGHELMDEFIDYFNDPRSVFAINQLSLLKGSAPSIAASSAADGATGYITYPASGARVLEETTIMARVTGASGAKISFVLAGTDGSVTLNAASKDNTYYTAALSQAQLETLGESADGTLTLLANGKELTKQVEIFNIPEPVVDPHQIDDFELYLGEDALLGRAWTTNKDTGCSISLTISDAPDEAQDGHGMKFTYAEKSGGWAGATINKEVDWSDCDALQFWTIPDGNAQKTVIQISANGKPYEAYMNLYDEYIANAGKPVLVTIPFAQFHNRDAAGQPKGGLENDCGSVTSFGLWVNAIDNDAFKDGMVNGSIWYDNIKAVKSGLSETTFEVR